MFASQWCGGQSEGRQVAVEFSVWDSELLLDLESRAGPVAEEPDQCQPLYENPFFDLDAVWEPWARSTPDHTATRNRWAAARSEYPRVQSAIWRFLAAAMAQRTRSLFSARSNTSAR